MNYIHTYIHTCMHNFIDINSGEFLIYVRWCESHLFTRFPPFSRDSDIAKWLEAACYTLKITPDPTLSQLVEEAVDNIRGAQQDDGYINTYFTVSVFTALRKCTRLMEGEYIGC